MPSCSCSTSFAYNHASLPMLPGLVQFRIGFACVSKFSGQHAKRVPDRMGLYIHVLCLFLRVPVATFMSKDIGVIRILHAMNCCLMVQDERHPQMLNAIPPHPPDHLVKKAPIISTSTNRVPAPLGHAVSIVSTGDVSTSQEQVSNPEVWRTHTPSRRSLLCPAHYHPAVQCEWT